MKELFNKFINWYYKKEYEEYLQKVQLLPINDAIYALEEIKKKINPKTNLIKKIEVELNKRISPFKPINIDPRIQAYQEMAKIGGKIN